MQKKNTLKISLGSLFAALCAAGGLITIPLPFSPVPLVLQNFFVLLSGLILGPLTGTASVVLFLFAGAIGLPVFSGARGGFVHFLSPSGGYLAGYVLCALAAGLIGGNPEKQRDISLARRCIAVFAGLLVVYVPGLLRLYTVLDHDWIKTVSSGFVPFIPGDIIKGTIAVLISPRLRRTLSDHLNA